MGCCIYICPNCLCACKAVGHVCPSQMGGNPTNQYCSSTQYQAIVAAGGTGSCVCPSKVSPSQEPLGFPGSQKIINTGKSAAKYVNDTATSIWDALKKDFSLVPSITTILIVLFVLMLIVVFVYGYARSR